MVHAFDINVHYKARIFGATTATVRSNNTFKENPQEEEWLVERQISILSSVLQLFSRGV